MSTNELGGKRGVTRSFQISELIPVTPPHSHIAAGEGGKGSLTCTSNCFISFLTHLYLHLILLFTPYSQLWDTQGLTHLSSSFGHERRSQARQGESG